MAYDFIDRLLGESSTSDSEEDHEGTMSDEESAVVERATDHDDENDHETTDAAQSGTEPPIEEVDARLDELETELADNESSIRSIESSQEEMAETMADLDDTVRRLLGVYDQLTAAENPFTRGDGGGRTDGASGDGFGLVDEPEKPPTPDEEPTTGEDDGTGAVPAADDDRDTDDRRSGPTDEPSDDRPGETTTVGFEDLLESGDGAADDEDAPTAATGPSADDAAGFDAATHEQGPTPTADAAVSDAATDAPDAVTSVQLAEFPSGYAADLLAMEWLANMVETSGPAGALKALSFYEELGWVSSDVADTLELYLSGPNLDDDVDPNSPVELTASDHAESYRYVLRLRALDDLDMTAE